MRLAKKNLLILGMMLAAPAFAVETLDAWDAYKDHLIAKNVAGDETGAAKYLDDARSKTRGDSSDLANFVNEDVEQGLKSDDPRLERAIKFLTGNKQETYCRNVGLVEINAQHKDGTKSHVVLGNQRREMGDSYAWVKDGTWNYELTNGYRPTMRSDLWMVSSSENSYRMKERRDQKNSNDLDTGDYQANWTADRSRLSNSFKSHGEVFEPFPMYMANDFHTWGGNQSLGRLISFKVGFEKVKTGINVHGFGYKILLKSKQTVAKHLPEVSVTNSSGSATIYNDCFQVDYDIQFEGLGKK